MLNSDDELINIKEVMSSSTKLNKIKRKKKNNPDRKFSVDQAIYLEDQEKINTEIKMSSDQDLNCQFKDNCEMNINFKRKESIDSNLTENKIDINVTT